MKKIIFNILFTLMLMVLQMRSQNISTVNSNKPPKAFININSKGDTILSFYLKDGRAILSDLLDYKIVDSLLIEYKKRDSIQTKTISLNIRDIRALELESVNKDRQISDLQKIVEKKITELINDEDVIANQKKEIRKQKIFKVLAMVTAVVLPVLVLIATIK